MDNTLEERLKLIAKYFDWEYKSEQIKTIRELVDQEKEMSRRDGAQYYQSLMKSTTEYKVGKQEAYKEIRDIVEKLKKYAKADKASESAYIR